MFVLFSCFFFSYNICNIFTRCLSFLFAGILHIVLKYDVKFSWCNFICASRGRREHVYFFHLWLYCHYQLADKSISRCFEIFFYYLNTGFCSKNDKTYTKTLLSSLPCNVSLPIRNMY